jgi:NADPH2:quinone reductase
MKERARDAPAQRRQRRENEHVSFSDKAYGPHTPMKSIRVVRTGGPESMILVDLPTPSPARDEVLVRVEAAGVNFIDVYFRSGAYAREVPYTPGEEGAGVVEALGSEVTSVRAGDRVAWANVSGSYSTHVLVHPERLVPVPAEVTMEQAAAAMLQGMTAHYLARSTFRLASGTTCLVHAAAGGVGLLLSQIARRSGARVLGTTSTEEKARLARDAGAEDVILYSHEPFDEGVRARTNGRGVDVVYDSVGAATFERSLLSLRPRGMVVLFGQSSGRVPPLDLQTLSARGSLFVTRPTLRDYIATRTELLERAGDVLGAIGRQELDIRIHQKLALARAPDAHSDLESRKTTGKTLLLPQA